VHLLKWFRKIKSSILVKSTLSQIIKIASQVKLKIQELSTGKKKVEEWSFLLEELDHNLNKNIRIRRNLALIWFGTTSDPLILNLVTRNKFWIRRAVIANEVREKAGRLDLNDFRVSRCIVLNHLYNENDRAYITLEIELDRAFDNQLRLLG